MERKLAKAQAAIRAMWGDKAEAQAVYRIKGQKVDLVMVKWSDGLSKEIPLAALLA